MAITITATAGDASANSYLTLADANAIIEGLVLDDDVAAWDGSPTDNKNRALCLLCTLIPPGLRRGLWPPGV